MCVASFAVGACTAGLGEEPGRDGGSNDVSRAGSGGQTTSGSGGGGTGGGTGGAVVIGSGGSGGSGGVAAGTGGQGGTGGGSGGRAGTGGTGGGSGGRAGTGGTGTGGAGTGGAGTGGSAPFPPIQNGCNGYATRFWDCCKPHCSWMERVPGGVRPANSCSASNSTVAANTSSSCDGGGAHMCYGMTPWAVNNQLAYGYAATSSGNVCGRCFQLQFTGSSHNGGNDPGSAALAGKTMIVQAINVGFDVGGGQFDVAIPGGGVGIFPNACSRQWNVPNGDLGVQYGGLLAACKQTHGYNASLDTYKTCVSMKCSSVFESRGLTDLAAACRWFVDWYQVADNPNVKYKEVACPAEIMNKSNMNRTGLNDISSACGN